MISVIICTFDQPLTLPWLLESLANQTYRESFEVLIADDGSEPEVLRLVAEQTRHHGLDIRYLWQPDEGFRLCRSRNNAIRCATGDILVFLDGDMVVRPNFLEAHLEAHHGGSQVLCCGTREHLEVRRERPPINAADALNLAEQMAQINPLESEARQQESWARSRSPWMAISGCNFSVRKSGNIWFDEGFTGWGSEDREFACRLMKQGYRIVVSDATRGVHVDVTESRSKQRQSDDREHSELTELIRNKLLLRHRHPDVDTTPALRMLQHCSVDPASGRWSYEPDHEPTELGAAIEAAEAQLGRTTTE